MSVPPPPGRDAPRRRRAREALVAALWDARGQRRLPTERRLVDALEVCGPRDAWWVCEANGAGPLYLLPTREWVRALAGHVDDIGARSVLEVGAGDGFLSACLARARPSLRIHATDSGAWARPKARMSAAEQRRYATLELPGLAPGPGVERLRARAAVEKYRPDLVIVSWPPPGLMVEHALRGPCRFVLEIGVEGDVCGNSARTWRYEKELLSGPIEDRALCRLDGAPRELRHTRVTSYYGARHPRHGLDPDFVR